MSDNVEATTDSQEESKFDINEAFEQSKEFIGEFLKDLILHDPEKGEDLFLVAPPSLNPDGSLTILCAATEDPEEFVAHTIISGYVSKDDVQFAPAPEAQPEPESTIISSPNAGKIVGLDGRPLN